MSAHCPYKAIGVDLFSVFNKFCLKVMFCFIMRISSCGFGEVSLILKSKFYMYFDA